MRMPKDIEKYIPSRVAGIRLIDLALQQILCRSKARIKWKLELSIYHSPEDVKSSKAIVLPVHGTFGSGDFKEVIKGSPAGVDPAKIKVWQIGPDGTEYFAARSEEEMKAYYRKMLGSGEESQTQANHDLEHDFEEVADLDEEFEMNDDGVKVKTSWRKLAESATALPCQISTGYN